jgi:hypothetical protein
MSVSGQLAVQVGRGSKVVAVIRIENNGCIATGSVMNSSPVRFADWPRKAGVR